MREPTRTIMPPSRAGSTRISTATRAPTARRSCSISAAGVFVERLRDRDLRGDLATAFGKLPQIGLNHLRNREQPPVASDDAEEIARQPGHPGGLAQRGDGFSLSLARQNGAAQQPS